MADPGAADPAGGGHVDDRSGGPKALAGGGGPVLLGIEQNQRGGGPSRPSGGPWRRRRERGRKGREGGEGGEGKGGGGGRRPAGHGPAAAAVAGGWEGREERGNLTLGY